MVFTMPVVVAITSVGRAKLDSYVYMMCFDSYPNVLGVLYCHPCAFERWSVMGSAHQLQLETNLALLREVCSTYGFICCSGLYRGRVPICVQTLLLSDSSSDDEATGNDTLSDAQVSEMLQLHQRHRKHQQQFQRSTQVCYLRLTSKSVYCTAPFSSPT